MHPSAMTWLSLVKPNPGVMVLKGVGALGSDQIEKTLPLGAGLVLL